VGGYIAEFNLNKVWNKAQRAIVSNLTTYTVLNDGYVVITLPKAYISAFVVYDVTSVETDAAYKYIFKNLEVSTDQLTGDIKLTNTNINIFREYKKFFVNTDYFTINKTAYPYTATYNGTNLYPFSGTTYDIPVTVGEKLYFFIDADIDAANTGGNNHNPVKAFVRSENIASVS
jgi:hypothetical protein